MSIKVSLIQIKFLTTISKRVKKSDIFICKNNESILITRINQYSKIVSKLNNMKEKGKVQAKYYQETIIFLHISDTISTYKHEFVKKYR